MTRLARLSLTNRTLVIMISLVIVGLGAYAVPQLKQQLFPSLELPMVSVLTPYPGASPEIVESQVTEPIENGLRSVEGVEELTSTSSENVSTVQVAFDYGGDTADLVRDIEAAVAELRPALPDDLEPNVIAGSTDDIPVLVLAVSGGEDQRDLAQRLERTVVPEIEAIEDVRDVTITGTREDRVVITPSAGLPQRGLSPASIAEALQANGVVVPAGSITAGRREITVQTGAEMAGLTDIENIYLTPSDRGAPVRLGDVAEVRLQPEDPSSITRTDGEPTLGLSVTMTTDGNAVGISHEVRNRLDGLAGALGTGAAITVIFDQSPAVERAIDDLTTEGLLGLAFAVLVIMIFLLSLRSTIVTAVSIPMSVIIALIALWLGDYSLNMLTLGALTIAIGRVVDDSIVVLENIRRHLSYGEPKREAVLDGVREVAGAVTSSTLTTVAVFAPIAFVSGVVGQLFSSFAITVTVALLASLLVSLTVIPVLAYWFMSRPKGSADRSPEEIRTHAETRELRNPLQRIYVPVLRFATRFRLVTIILGIGVLAGTFALIPGLRTNFLDSSGQDTTQVSQRMPEGTDLATTDQAARRIENVLAETEGVASYQVNIGSGGPIFGGLGGSADRASYSITVADGADTPTVERELRQALAELDDIGDVTVGAQSGRQQLGGSAVQVLLTGADRDALATAADRVHAAVADINGVRDVTSDLSDAAPRVEVQVDPQRAATAGLTEAAIGQQVAQAFRGSPIGEATVDGRTVDLVLGSGTAPDSVRAIEALPLLTPTGPVRLSDLAEVVQVAGPTQISRVDGDRAATISAAADANDLGRITGELTTALQNLDLPTGVDYQIGGASADQQEAFADLTLAMIIAIALVFMIMVATFRSFVQPLILLVSIPFAATGAIGLLRITDTPLGVPAMVGLLMLIGIVVTNAIVLIDLINQYRSQGMQVRDAVIAGGRRRLRPILMTAVATICALLPMAIGLTGSGGFISRSLAIVVIGGLISSTLLTLILVPTLYSIVEGTKARFRRKFRPSPQNNPTKTEEPKTKPEPDLEPAT